ncbi:MAG TPA: PilZ domain-containing protein [Candidatus Wunengus sp. YC63]|uniref:PilZ domain-containing protein n=1 Tax=unclassified Candidatus Wunengus TaxID=3367695 RepID=UPI0040294043
MSSRIPYPCPMSYVAMGNFVSPPGVVEVKGKILDISDSGVRIQIDDQALETGTVVCIRVPVYKSKSKTPITVPVLAEIRWVNEELPAGRQMGLRFMM